MARGLCNRAFFIMLETIKQIIEKEFRLPDISDATRVYPYPEARAIFYEIAKKTAPTKSFSKIAAVVNRDHATALHAIQMLNDTYLRDYEIIEIYDKIKELVFKDVTLHKHKFSELEMLRRENIELKRKLEELQKIRLGRSEQLVCSCGSIKVQTTGGSQCPNNRCSSAN